MHCTILKAAALLALNLQLVSAAWPAGNFTYMIPFAKGGGSAAAAEMQKKFTPAATLVYNGINSGATAWGNMKNDPKDGSVITLVNLPHIYIQPYIPSLNANYTPDDITIAYIHTYTPLALLVPANSTIQTWDDFVALCARKPVVISGAGTGTVFELGTSRLSKLAKIGITYESGGTGATAAIEKMVRGEYDAAWTTTPVVKGRTDVRTIAIASEFEFPAIDAPTFKTLGVNYVDGIYRGVGVPAGTPVSIVQEISNYFNTLNRNASFISMVQADNTALIFMPYNSASMNKFTANYRAAVNNDLFPKDPISAVSIYAMWILATLGIIACAAAAVFAFVFRNTPVIKGSSYFFNNIIIFGIMVAYSSMYVSSIHKPIPNVTRDVMSRACVALPWVLGLGFDITFAAILVKSYRLYRLFMFSAAKIVQFQATNAAIMKWVLGICGMNTLVYLVWTAHDPLYADLHSLDGDNTFYYSCTSKHAPAYLGTILSFKYIMLMGCIFFCIKLRDLNAMLNETKAMSAAVFVTTFTLTVCLAVYSMLSSFEGRYIILVGGTFLGTTTVFLSLFLPKILLVFFNPDANTFDYVRRVVKGSDLSRGASSGGGEVRSGASLPGNSFGGSYMGSQMLTSAAEGMASSPTPVTSAMMPPHPHMFGSHQQLSSTALILPPSTNPIYVHDGRPFAKEHRERLAALSRVICNTSNEGRVEEFHQHVAKLTKFAARIRVMASNKNRTLSMASTGSQNKLDSKIEKGGA